MLYEDTPKMDMWIKLMLAGMTLAFLVAGVVFLFQDTEGAFVMLGDGVFIGLLFKLIMPRRYQVYNDRFRIVLGGPFAWNIPLSTIKEARVASGAKAFAYSGVRFATSSKGVVEIIRSKGCDVVISPSNREFFSGATEQSIKQSALSFQQREETDR